MKVLKKIFIVCIIIIVLCVVAASIYVRMYGKGLLEQTLSRSLEKEVRLGSVSYQFPFGVRVGNVRVDRDFSAGEVLAQFAPASLWAEPRRVSRLIIKGGTYSYAGRGESPLRFRVEDIRLRADDLLVPLAPGRTNFKFSGRLVQQKNPLNGSRVEGSGWLDWVKRDMDGTLQVVDSSGHAGLNARAVSQNNDMTVTGSMKLTGLPSSASQSAEGMAVNELITGVLSAAGVEIGAQFFFKTKMDDLQISNIAFSGKVTAGEGFSQIFSGELPVSPQSPPAGPPTGEN